MSSPIGDARPWLTYSALALLDSLVRPYWAAQEWGAGGSTLWLAERVGRLLTVEHDESWATIVRRKLSDRQHYHDGVLIRTVTPDARPIADAAHASAFVGGNFERYCQTRDKRGPVDLLLVDGRARVGCILAGRGHVRPGGWLVLDNAERDRYAPAVSCLLSEGWAPTYCDGPGPYTQAEWRTAFFRKPEV